MKGSTADCARSRRSRFAALAGSLFALVALACDTTEPRRAVALGIATQPPNTAQSGVALTQAPVIELRDQDGAAFAQPGLTVTASLDGGGTLGGTTTQATDAEGRATFADLVISGTVGPRTLRFSATGLTAATSSSINLSAGPPATLEAVSQTNVQATVGTAVTPLPSVVMKDASGNPVAGVPITFRALSGNAGELTGTTQATSSSGVATLGGWILPTTTGQYTVSATATGIAGTIAFMVQFIATATADAPNAMQPSGGGQSALYGSRLATPLQVRVVDQYGNPTPGVVVTWGSLTGVGTVEPINVATDESGIVRSNYRLGTTPGENVVRASISSRSLTADFSATALGFTNQLEISTHHTCALDESGVAYCWGQSDYGQVGDRTTVNRSAPTRVFGALRFRRITTGYGVTCALTTDNVPYCWGFGTYGALGTGTKTHRMEPTPVGGGLHFTEISTGGYTTCGVTSEGAAYCWGSNQDDQLGIGTGAQLDTCTDPLNPTISFECSLVPMQVAGGLAFKSISVGAFHVCALTTAASELYCWGLGWTYGSQGSVNGGFDPSPVRVAPTYTFASVFAGGSITCGIVAPSSPYCWGSGSRGALGNGTVDAYQGTPGPVLDLAAVQIDGDFGVCAVATDARAFCWGFNAYGAVGDGTTTDRTMATPVSTSLSFTKISASGYHTCGRVTNGQVYCWGYNGAGALGVGDNLTHWTPALARP